MTEQLDEPHHSVLRPASRDKRVEEDPQASSVLSVTGLTKSYGKTRAVDDVHLTIKPGEFVALLGPNGAGKSTLFQMLTGLFVPDGGRAVVAGHDIRHRAVKALSHLGVVFQQPTIDMDTTVLRNLRFHARLHGLSRSVREHRIEEVLSLVGLERKATAVVRTLSGGNRRRVELARALLHEPALLLMDEPTVGLDPASRRDLIEQVHKLCRERDLGLLWATHLVDEADNADRVLVMQDGRVVAAAHPEQIVAETQTRSLTDAFHALTGKPAATTEAPA